MSRIQQIPNKGLHKEILGLAIPNIISNVSVPLLSTVDTILMGHLSALHIGAVGLGSMIFNFVYWNFGFLRMGTTGISAQAFGRNDRAAIIHTLFRASIVALILASLIFLFKAPLLQLSVWAMQVTDTQVPLISTYYSIRILAVPATLLLYGFMGWFFGMQNAIFPLILTIWINCVNIALSIYLIEYKGMEIEGVAWGTVIAQYSGILLAFLLFYIKYKDLLSHFRIQALKQIDVFVDFMRINSDIFLRTFALTLSFVFFHAKSSEYGETILAVNIILMQYINWMSYGIDGFAFAAESLVGKYYGAQDEPRLRKTIKFLFFWGLCFALIYALIYWIFGKKIFSLFTNQLILWEASESYFIWVILLPIFGFACYLWDGIFIGLTASVAMRNTMLLSMLVYFGTYYVSYPFIQYHAIWLSLSVFLLVRALSQGYVFMRKGIALK